MPGFDGTGPAGMGPMTGGGRGKGRGMGMVSGIGIGGGIKPIERTSASAVGKEQDLEKLKSEAEAVAQQLSDIQLRIKELEEKK